MARGKGTANLAASLEVLAGAPLDARDVCPTVADLYVAANWPYKYIGMKTTVQATGDTYRLVNLDVTQESSWVLEGASEYTDFIGATSQAAGIHGLVPAPAIADSEKFLKGDGTWGVVPMPSFDYSNTSPDAMNFSSDEKIIGTWIDGKPLYQKVISQTYSSLPADTSSMGGKLLNVTSLSIDRPVNLRVLLPSSFRPTGNFMQNNNSNVTNGIDVTFKSTTAINLQAGSAISPYLTNATLDFVLQYTKTTDQPVATGEKIVGQWIDGKALYEKTGTFTSADYESGTTTWEYCDLLNLPDTITLVDVSGFIRTSSYGVAPIGTKNKIDNSRYWDSYFNYKKRIVFDNHVGANLSESINITVRYTKAS